MPSCARSIQVSSDTNGFRKKLSADLLTRAQWRSRSGVTPSNVRAPSNTMEPSQAAWVRGPMIGTLPSCQSPSKNVQVFECTGAFVAGTGAAAARLRVESPDPVHRARKFMANSPGAVGSRAAATRAIALRGPTPASCEARCRGWRTSPAQDGPCRKPRTPCAPPRRLRRAGSISFRNDRGGN